MSIEEIQRGIEKIEQEPYSWKGLFKLKILKIALSNKVEEENFNQRDYGDEQPETTKPENKN